MNAASFRGSRSLSPTDAPEKWRVLGCVELLSPHLGFNDVPPPGAAVTSRQALGDQASSRITPRTLGRRHVCWVRLSARLPQGQEAKRVALMGTGLSPERVGSQPCYTQGVPFSNASSEGLICRTKWGFAA